MAQLASIRQMSRQVSRGSAGEYQPRRARSGSGVCNFSLTQPLGAASSEVLPIPGQPSSATERKEAAPQLTEDAPVDISPSGRSHLLG